jgi:hypothetical protein
LVERALAKDPAERPTARALLDELLTTAPSSREADRMLAAAASASAVSSVSAVSGSGTPGRGSDVPISPASVPDGRVGKRRSRLVLVAAVVAAVLLVPAVLVGPRLVRGVLDGAATSTGPSVSRSLDPVPVGSGKPRPSLDPVEAALGILNGQRRTLLHVAEIDRDLSVDGDGRVHVGDGTGPEAVFVLQPFGVDYMIKSLNPEIAHRPCLGVKRQPSTSSSLVGADCVATQATLFSIRPLEESKDDQGRPTHVLYNEEHGFVQWSRSRRVIYVEFIGDGEVDTTFSLVDRGAV